MPALSIRICSDRFNDYRVGKLSADHDALVVDVDGLASVGPGLTHKASQSMWKRNGGSEWGSNPRNCLPLTGSEVRQCILIRLENFLFRNSNQSDVSSRVSYLHFQFIASKSSATHGSVPTTHAS